MKYVKVEIGLGGEVSIEAVGYKGKGCEAATKALEEALGNVSSRKKKPEYDAVTTNQQTQTT